MTGYEQAYNILKANGMAVDVRMRTRFTLIRGQWAQSFDTHEQAVNAGLALLKRGEDMVWPEAFYNR